VTNEASWLSCLSYLERQDQGFCVPRFKTRPYSSPMTSRTPFVDQDGEMKCCNQNASSSHLCFYFRQLNSNSGKSTKNATGDKFGGFSCLPARYVTNHMPCNQTRPCNGIPMTSSSSTQNGNTICAYAALFNRTKLIRFQLDRNRPPVLFVGRPSAVRDHVTVSGFVPRRYLHGKLPMPDWLPHFLDLVLRYLFTLSLAFALLNAVPCYSLDGQHFWSALMLPAPQPVVQELVVERNRFWAYRLLMYKALMLYGTLALILVVIGGLVLSLMPHFQQRW